MTGCTYLQPGCDGDLPSVYRHLKFTAGRDPTGGNYITIASDSVRRHTPGDVNKGRVTSARYGSLAGPAAALCA